MATPTVLIGSNGMFAATARRVGDLASQAPFEVTLILRRARLHGVPEGEGDAPDIIDSIQHAQLNGASETDIERVKSFAADNAIEVVTTAAARRAIVLRAAPAVFAAAFGVRFGLFERGGVTCRSYNEPIRLAPALAQVVEAVIGFEDARAAQTFFLRGLSASPAWSLTPAMLAAVYNFPQRTDGAGQSIAVVGFAGKVAQDEAKAYAQAMSCPTPSIDVIEVCDPSKPDAATADDCDGLSAMLQVLSTLAPGARLTAYLTAPSERGCVDALLAAVYASQAPDVICLGWGFAEAHVTGPTARAIDAILLDAAALGITVCAAAGDSGSALYRGSDLAAVQLPAASPYALACGTTALTLLDTGWFEQVWNEGPQGAASGGGVSVLAAVPSWQLASQPPLSVRTGRPGRGVPDVAAHAARLPGLSCLVGGRALACGGTALSTALWSALLAHIRQSMAECGHDARIGLVAPRLYRLASFGLFNSPPLGSNESTGHVGGYFARPGWDPCTGLGSPNGKRLLDALLADAEPSPGPRAKTHVTVQWTWEPGLVREIVEGRDGTLWALGMVEVAGQWPLFRATPFGWALVPGAFGCALAIGRDAKPWLASDRGVIRHFDGTSWHTHAGLASSLAIASDGALWIVAFDKAGSDGAVQRWSNGEFVDSGIVARRLKIDSAGVLLALRADGTGLRLAGTKWRKIAGNVSDLAVDQAGSVWAVTRGAGRIWRLYAPDAVWQDAKASVAARLVGCRDGSLLALQADGTMFTGRAQKSHPTDLKTARSA